MGILDSLGLANQGGYAGLLDALMYPSPLNKPQDAPPQPLYDALGTPFAAAPSTAVDPFGPPPQMAEWAKQFQPQSASAAPSPFTGGAPAAPVQQFAGIPVLPQPAAAPVPEPVPEPPQRMLGIGGYQMPQIGTAAEYTPQQTPTDISAQSRTAPQPAPQPLPPALGGEQTGFFDKLNRGLQSVGNGGSIIGAFTGNRTDPQSVGQQNLKAQYDYLVPLLGPQKAALAVLSPKAAETLLPQALEKKQYGFMKTDGDQIIRTDPLKGTAEVAYGGDDGKKAGVAGPDGKIIPYPEGLDSAGRKTFANAIAHANADAATGKLTEVQAKSQKFGNQMELAQQNIKGLEAEGKSIFGQIASGVPLGNLLQSKEYQKYTQAKNSFLTAILRDESGAAIGSQEFIRREKEMFPQPGDDADTMRQKAQLRHVAVEGMKKAAGPGYKAPSEVTTQSSLPSGWSVQVR